MELSEALEVSQDHINRGFILSKNYNHAFGLYLQIDQLTNEDNFKNAYKSFSKGGIYTKENYLKSLSKGIQMINQFTKDNGKTKLADDLKEYEKTMKSMDGPFKK